MFFYCYKYDKQCKDFIDLITRDWNEDFLHLHLSNDDFFSVLADGSTINSNKISNTCLIFFIIMILRWKAFHLHAAIIVCLFYRSMMDLGYLLPCDWFDIKPYYMWTMFDNVPKKEA